MVKTPIMETPIMIAQRMKESTKGIPNINANRCPNNHDIMTIKPKSSAVGINHKIETNA